MSNLILIQALSVARGIIQTLNRKGVEHCPRVEISDGDLTISFHLNGDRESDEKAILVISEALDLGLTPATKTGSYWATDEQEIAGIPVETVIFSKVYAATPEGKPSLKAVSS